jgi:hypothetical protein
MATNSSPKKTEENPGFAFNKQNYILIIIGLVVLGIGLLLLIGGGSDNPKVFNYAIFDFQRLTLAPILILAGYIIEIFAIMRLPKSKSTS